MLQDKVNALIAKLDSKRAAEAEEAACELLEQRFTDAIIDAICEGKFRTVKGRVRAAGVLLELGKSVPQALDAYSALLEDSSLDVLSSALFGMVFWQDKKLVPRIEKVLTSCTRPRLRKEMLLAIKALQSGNPFLYSRYFHDVNKVWKLDPKRFSKHVGPV